MPTSEHAGAVIRRFARHPQYPHTGVVVVQNFTLRRCAFSGTTGSGKLATKGTAILASLTMILLATPLYSYGRGFCLIDIGTEGATVSQLPGVLCETVRIADRSLAGNVR
jgi:hypothetical protein